MMTARRTRCHHGIPSWKISPMLPTSGDSFSFLPPLRGRAGWGPLVGYWMPKAKIEERRRVGEMLGAAEYDDEDRPAVTGCGRGQTVTGRASVAGLDADRSGVGREQPVDIDRVERLVLRGRVDGDLL